MKIGLLSDAGAGAGPATAATDTGEHISAAACATEYRAADSTGLYFY